jgi:Ohr subfamily peroxiredoxin
MSVNLKSSHAMLDVASAELERQGKTKKERVMAEAETGRGKVVYTARTRTTGGRDHGISRSCDGHLDVKLASPGSPRIGTNPEQLFAAAWSACFESAVAIAARKSKIPLGEVTIDAEIDLHLADSNDYFLSARFNISIPGIDRAVAQDLVQQAEQLCPYSKVTRGNIDVTLNLLTAPR